MAQSETMKPLRSLAGWIPRTDKARVSRVVRVGWQSSPFHYPSKTSEQHGQHRQSTVLSPMFTSKGGRDERSISDRNGRNNSPIGIRCMSLAQTLDYPISKEFAVTSRVSRFERLDARFARVRFTVLVDV